MKLAGFFVAVAGYAMLCVADWRVCCGIALIVASDWILSYCHFRDCPAWTNEASS